MSGLVMGLVFEQAITETFGRPEKYILLAYADHADQNGGSIYPSVELIGKKTGYEERSVQAITRKLEQLGYLVPDGQGPCGTNRWRIPLVRTAEGGAKIAPLPVQIFAPEGIAPEGIAPEPSVVVNTDERFSEVAQKLSELTGGLNSKSADVIGEWLGKHTNEWIFKAIEIAKSKGARSANYVDSILIGWEANGYPKSRDEKVSGAKHANGNPSNSRRTSQTETPAYTDADRAAAERVRQRKASRAAVS